MKACSILVVDDEPGLRDIITMVLRGEGHRVTVAENGLEASKALTNDVFDVVVTDVIMPERDGMQIIGEVRRRYPGMKIVAMSGGGHVSREQYLKIAKGLGAHAVLEKPFANTELLAALGKLFPETTA
jgi:DNA-binding NtrC family response regulator